MIHSSLKLIWEPWLDRAIVRPDDLAIVHWRLEGLPVTWTAGALFAAAFDVCGRLKASGVRRNEVCALILRHHPAFYPVYLGIVLAGAVPAVLAYPNSRLHPEKFRGGLEGMLKQSGFDWILTEKTLLPLLGVIGEKAGRAFRGIMYPLDWVREPSDYQAEKLSDIAVERADPGDPCLLQHSSGTTGLQKPIMLSHASVLEHLRCYGEAIQASPSDRVVSWLPLYHDMGLIAAFHLPLGLGIPLVQLDPMEWVQAPASLLRAISEHRGTLAWMPNFAFNLMAERVRDDDLDGVRLDSMRLFVNCSERVKAGSHDRFAGRFAKIGLNPGALGASYAMAEATFAVTQTAPGIRAPVCHIDRQAMAEGRVVRLTVDNSAAVACVSSGRLVKGCEIRVVSEAGDELPADRIGHLRVRSSALFDGYRNHPEKTSETLIEGWYLTGDIGFRVGDEYFVIGRSKDVIIVAGKNIYPEDIETVVNEVDGVLPGRAVAFGVENATSGTEEIWIVAETGLTDEPAIKALRHGILKASLHADVTVSRVVLVPPRWLFKTSSGKPCRHTNRERAMAETTQRV